MENFDNLQLETSVTANRPICPCKGGGTEQINGIIKKVIANPTGTYYYLDIGSTIKSDWIISINQ